MNPEDIELRFTYHVPTENAKSYMSLIRSGAARFADLLNDYCKDGRELSLAITKLEEATFWAIASIARNGIREDVTEENSE